MALKLIFHIIIVALVVCFFGFNFETKVDIKFWFGDSLTVKGASLFISLGVAYLLGIITFLPSYVLKSFKGKKSSVKKEKKIVKPKVKSEPTVSTETETTEDNA